MCHRLHVGSGQAAPVVGGSTQNCQAAKNPALFLQAKTAFLGQQRPKSAQNRRIQKHFSGTPHHRQSTPSIFGAKKVKKRVHVDLPTRIRHPPRHNLRDLAFLAVAAGDDRLRHSGPMSLVRASACATNCKLNVSASFHVAGLDGPLYCVSSRLTSFCTWVIYKYILNFLSKNKKKEAVSFIKSVYVYYAVLNNSPACRVCGAGSAAAM